MSTPRAQEPGTLDTPFSSPELHPTIRVDWLAITFHEMDPWAVRQLISDLLAQPFPQSWEMRRMGLKSYKSSYEGPHGMILAFSEGRPDCHLLIRGKACGALSRPDMDTLLLLALRQGSITRLDLALDDHQKRVTCRQLEEAFLGTTSITRAKNLKLYESKSRKGELTGITLQVGSRKGLCYLKLYDKELESQGEIPAMRWELTLKDKLAREALKMHLEGHTLGEVFTSFLTRFLDFREPGKGPSRERPRCEWFANIVGDAERAVLPQPSKEKPLAGILLWLWDQVGPWLAVVDNVCGRDSELFKAVLCLSEARTRWQNTHHKVAKEGMDGLQQALHLLGKPDLLRSPALIAGVLSNPRSPVTVDVGYPGPDIDGDGAKGVPP